MGTWTTRLGQSGSLFKSSVFHFTGEIFTGGQNAHKMPPPACRSPSRLSKDSAVLGAVQFCPCSCYYHSSNAIQTQGHKHGTTPSPKNLPLEKMRPLYLQSTLIVHVDLWVKGQGLGMDLSSAFYNSMRWRKISGLILESVFHNPLQRTAMDMATLKTLHMRNLKL